MEFSGSQSRFKVLMEEVQCAADAYYIRFDCAFGSKRMSSPPK
jgi:hypothetical protein